MFVKIRRANKQRNPLIFSCELNVQTLNSKIPIGRIITQTEINSLVEIPARDAYEYLNVK